MIVLIFPPKVPLISENPDILGSKDMLGFYGDYGGWLGDYIGIFYTQRFPVNFLFGPVMVRWKGIIVCHPKRNHIRSAGYFCGIVSYKGIDRATQGYTWLYTEFSGLHRVLWDLGSETERERDIYIYIILVQTILAQAAKHQASPHTL